MQPPGKRMNPGCMSSSSCTRSLRRPFGRWFQVSTGNSETMSRSMAPLLIHEQVQPRFRLGRIRANDRFIVLAIFR